MVKRRSRHERPIHPTRATLVDTTVRLLDDTPVEQLTCDEVLEVSGVSRGSLYHHFIDFPDLVEHALVARFATFVDQSIDSLAEIVESSASRDDLRDRFREFTRITQSRDRAPRRLERMVTFANSANSDRFREMLGAEQQRLTTAIAELVEVGQQRGWVCADIDPHATAVLIQAYTLGRVLDDVSPQPVDVEAWVDLIDRMVERTILAP